MPPCLKGLKAQRPERLQSLNASMPQRPQDLKGFKDLKNFNINTLL